MRFFIEDMALGKRQPSLSVDLTVFIHQEILQELTKAPSVKSSNPDHQLIHK